MRQNFSPVFAEHSQHPVGVHPLGIVVGFCASKAGALVRVGNLQDSCPSLQRCLG